MKAVIRDILNGNTAAFRQIVQQYDQQLLGIAYQYFHDWEEARDVTQDTFIKFFKNLDRYDPDYPLDPWIYRIHVNTCRSHYRKMKVRKLFFADLPAGESAATVNDVHDDSLVIMNCVDRLPWAQKTAFILIEIKGFTARETAAVLGCKAGTVRVHLNRARKTLQTKLKKLGYAHE
jgi:RNA polymerase sigma-70 factor (ECF subfamily)